MTRGEATNIRSALAPLERMLGADGYSLSVEEDTVGQRLIVRVEPLGDSCAECLVPADVLATIISNALGPDDARHIEIVMPSVNSGDDL